MNTLDKTDWYWIINKQIYSSKTNSFVETDNQDYLSWCLKKQKEFFSDFMGTTLPDITTLHQVLKEYGIDRASKIKIKLAEIDLYKIRAMSDILLNKEVEFATAKIQQLENEAEQLRIELASLDTTNKLNI